MKKWDEIEWVPGVEHEVGYGVYAMLHGTVNDWWVWRVETSGHLATHVVKAAQGGTPPIPMGYHHLFAGPDAYLSFSLDDPVMVAAKGARIFNPYRFQVRLPGQRFFSERSQDFDPTAYDGTPFEVLMHSHPESTHSDQLEPEHAVFDSSGYMEALDFAFKAHDNRLT